MLYEIVKGSCDFFLRKGKKKRCLEVATMENFSEQAYLLSNPDVKRAVELNEMESGLHHFLHFGINENRFILIDDFL